MINIQKTKACLVRVMIFPVVMYGYESWTIKKIEHQRTDTFELQCWRRLLWVLWAYKNEYFQWILIGRTDVEAETPIIWPCEVKNWLIGKDIDVREDWRLEGKGMTEDEMVGWHHRLNGHGFEQAPGVGDDQQSLACHSSWDHNESDTAGLLNWTEYTETHYFRFSALLTIQINPIFPFNQLLWLTTYLKILFPTKD